MIRVRIHGQEGDCIDQGKLDVAGISFVMPSTPSIRRDHDAIDPLSNFAWWLEGCTVVSRWPA